MLALGHKQPTEIKYTQRGNGIWLSTLAPINTSGAHRTLSKIFAPECETARGSYMAGADGKGEGVRCGAGRTRQDIHIKQATTRANSNEMRKSWGTLHHLFASSLICSGKWCWLLFFLLCPLPFQPPPPALTRTLPSLVCFMPGKATKPNKS